MIKSRKSLDKLSYKLEFKKLKPLKNNVKRLIILFLEIRNSSK
jgi:hypothetical protein